MIGGVAIKFKFYFIYFLFLFFFCRDSQLRLTWRSWILNVCILQCLYWADVHVFPLNRSFSVIRSCTNAAPVKRLSGYTFDSQCPWRIASIWASLSLSSPATPPVNIYEIQHGPSVKSRLQAAVWQDDRGSIAWKMDDNTKATLPVVRCPSLSSIIKRGEMGRPRRKWNYEFSSRATADIWD